MKGIYKIYNVECGKSYIGSAKNIKKRWLEHKNALKYGIHHSIKLQRAWDKYGEKAFSFEILEIVESDADLISTEQKWIDVYRCASEIGYNICPKAGSSLGRKFSEETKLKMSKKATGRVATEETRLKQSAASLGKAKSDQHKRNISLGQKGKVIPEVTRIAVGNANRVRKYSEETRSKLRIASAKSAEISKSKALLTQEILLQMLARCEYTESGRIRRGMVSDWARQYGLSKSRISKGLKKAWGVMHDFPIPDRSQIHFETGEILQ